MSSKVVLDALIPREDFEIIENVEVHAGDYKTTLSIQDLEHSSFFFRAIRKPDFQRETNEWTPEKVEQFIESFINGELIPAVILWKNSNGMIFVIDGTHRLSALSAWINDDYGDGKYSLKYFGNDISKEQKKVAEETRTLINSKVGSFESYRLATDFTKEFDELMIKRVLNLGSLAVQVQWVKGDSKKAEESFFKINEKASPIDNTEKKLIVYRNKAIGIASRAIMRSGKGHKYWSKFESEKQETIQKLATEIHELLFKPEYSTPIKTLDLPIGGKVLSNQGLALVNDTIVICNKLSSKDLENCKDDITGDETIKCLINTRKVLQRINSIHPSSLGLHPIVYFYSERGIHKVASYYGILAFVMYLDEKNRFNDFIKVRKDFECTLLNYEFLIQQIVRHDRQSFNGYKNIKEYYIMLLDNLLAGSSIEKSIKNIQNTKKFSYFTLALTQVEESKAKKFSRDKKAIVFIKESIKNTNKCAICGGYLHINSITVDHITRKREGGLASTDNGQLTHPYCNTTFKG
jgi:hypothetical protein